MRTTPRAIDARAYAAGFLNWVLMHIKTTVGARVRLAACAAVCGAMAAVPLPAQSPDAGTFITTLGTDTLAVEQYTRTGNTITGDYVTRPGGTVVNHYVLRFGPDGLPARLELTQRRGDGTPAPGAPKSVTMTMTETEAVVVIQRDTAITRRFAVHGALPLLGTSMGLLEVAFTRLRAAHADSTSFAGVPMNAAVLPDPVPVKFFGADSARFWSSTGPQYLRVDAAGRILGLSGRATESKIEGRRVAKVDLPKLIAGFAAADAAGRGIRD